MTQTLSHAPFLILIGLTLAFSTAASAREDAHVLVLGRVSDNPAAHYDQLKPLLNYVVERMGDLGIREGQVLMARDGAAMANYLRQERVDWLTETAGAALAMIARGGAEPLALSWRGGLEQYHSVLVARRDSGIDGIDQLNGRTIAFQHPMSTSAYLVPAGMLLDRGKRLAVLLSPLDRPPPEFVGYAFTGAEANSVAWVHKRLVDVAAISNQDFHELIRPVPEYARDLRVIARSPDYPRSLELVRGNLPEAIRRRLLEILLSAGDDPEGRDAMSRYFGTQRFSPVTSEIDDQMAALRPLVGRVREALQ